MIEDNIRMKEAFSSYIEQNSGRENFLKFDKMIGSLWFWFGLHLFIYIFLINHCHFQSFVSFWGSIGSVLPFLDLGPFDFWKLETGFWLLLGQLLFWQVIDGLLFLTWAFLLDFTFLFDEAQFLNFDHIGSNLLLVQIEIVILFLFFIFIFLTIKNLFLYLFLNSLFLLNLLLFKLWIVLQKHVSIAIASIL